MAGGITALRMNLDFLFNTSSAEVGFAKMRKGFQNLSGAAEAFTEAIKTSAPNVVASFTEMRDSIKENLTTGGDLEKVFAGLGNASAVIDNMGLSLEAFYYKQLDVISGMKGINAETAAFTANAAMVEMLSDTAKATEVLAQQFDKLGISYDRQNLAEKLLEVGVQSEKTFNKFNKQIDAAVELMAGLNQRQLAQYRQEMEQLQTALDEGTISVEEYTRSLKRLNDRTDIINNKLPQVGREFANLFSGVRGGFLSTLAAASIFDDALSAQAQTVETTHRLALRNIGVFEGQAEAAQDFGKTVRQMNASVRNVGRETQISMTRASEAMNSLAAARIPGTIEDLENLAVTSVRMSQAFGVSEGQAADLMRTLSLSGGLSPAGINEVGEALADVQAVWGMTSEEATEAAAQIGRVINRMTAMGANSIKNANIVAREVGRMTTAFNRAGLSAQDASQMMDRFMDPTKIEDNALLWHSMGMSVSDGLAMMTGDASSMEGMTERLMQTAKNLREEYGQNPLALQAMAEAHGLTIQQVNQLANELDREANMTEAARKEMERQADLESQAAQARESAAEAIKRLAAIGNVLMQSFVMPLLDALMFILNPLIKFVGWIQSLGSKLAEMGPVGNTIIKVLRGLLGAMLLFFVTTRIQIWKLIPGIGKLAGSFGSMFSGIKSGASAAIEGIKAFSKGFARSMKQNQGFLKSFARGFKGMTQQIKNAPGLGGSRGNRGGADSVRSAPQAPAGADTSAEKTSKLGKALEKIDGKKIMMLGVALLAVAGAVLLLALSYKMLVDTVKSAEPGELAVAFGMLVVILGLVAVMAKILAQVSKAAAPQIMVLGVALLLVAAAVAVIVLSLAVLFSSLQNLTGEQILGGLAALIVVFTGLIVILLIMASIGPAVAAGLIPLGVALLIVAAAFLVFGLAVVLVGIGLQLIINAISSAGEAFAQNSAIIAAGIFMLIPAIAALGIVGLIAFFGIMAVAGGLMMLAVASVMIAKSMPIVNQSLEQFVTTIKYMRENMKDIRSALRELGAGIGELAAATIGAAPSLIAAGVGLMLMAIATRIGATSIGVFTAGLGALIPLLERFAETSGQLSAAAQEFALASAMMARGLIAIALTVPMAAIALLGLVVMIPLLLIMNFALSSIANSFARMGEGAQLFANNIGAVIGGIRNLKDELSGVKGLANDFVREVNAMNVAFQQLANTGGIGMSAIQNLSQSVSVERNEEDNGMMTKMDTVIEHLSAISGYTARTANATENMLERMNRNSRQAFNAEAEANIPG